MLVSYPARLRRPDKNKTTITITIPKTTLIIPTTTTMIFPFQDYYNSALTGSMHAATKRKAKDDTVINYDDKKSEINADNNSMSNNIRCADSEDNNDNNKDGNFIVPPLPLPPIVMLIMPLLGEIIRIM